MASNTEISKITDLLSEIKKSRNVELVEETDGITIIEDGIKVFRATRMEHCIHAEMLPDIFTYSNIKRNAMVGSLHFNGKGHMCVYLDADVCDMSELIAVISDALVDLNLYGYRTSD